MVIISGTGYQVLEEFGSMWKNEDGGGSWERHFSCRKARLSKPIRSWCKRHTTDGNGFAFNGNGHHRYDFPKLKAGLGWITKFHKRFSLKLRSDKSNKKKLAVTRKLVAL